LAINPQAFDLVGSGLLTVLFQALRHLTPWIEKPQQFSP
jgi:hypothetical protein